MVISTFQGHLDICKKIFLIFGSCTKHHGASYVCVCVCGSLLLAHYFQLGYYFMKINVLC